MVRRAANGSGFARSEFHRRSRGREQSLRTRRGELRRDQLRSTRHGIRNDGQDPLDGPRFRRQRLSLDHGLGAGASFLDRLRSDPRRQRSARADHGLDRRIVRRDVPDDAAQYRQAPSSACHHTQHHAERFELLALSRRRRQDVMGQRTVRYRSNRRQQTGRFAVRSVHGFIVREQRRNGFGRFVHARLLRLPQRGLLVQRHDDRDERRRGNLAGPAAHDGHAEGQRLGLDRRARYAIQLR